MQSEPINIFCSCHPKDSEWCEELKKHLEPLQYQNIIKFWSHHDIIAGSDRAKRIMHYINTASIILCLVSPDFFASDCYLVELPYALERDKANQARLLPIALRPVEFKNTLLEDLQFLPRQGQPITLWVNRDAAFADVVSGIRRVIEDIDTLNLAKEVADSIRNVYPSIWNIPYPRNTFFLGRDFQLEQLKHQLQQHKASGHAQPFAINGLGGIGKTQLAVEYAYKYAKDYRQVLWLRSDTQETLMAAFVEVARLLKLPEQQEQDQSIVAQAVKRWLSQHESWLLIFDNVEDLRLIRDFIPSLLKGDILLTTRSQITGGFAVNLSIDILDQENGALLLLRRAGTLKLDDTLDKATESERLQAMEISEKLGGLPLALDQAGAYIEEAQCTIDDYLHIYRQKRLQLLSERGSISADHPEGVLTTWSISFEKIEKESPAAAEMLRFFAFLHPDAIPEELPLQAAKHLGPTLINVDDTFEFNKVIAVLRRFSFVRKNSKEKTLAVHRLVLAIVQDTLAQQVRDEWIARTIKALNAVYPGAAHKTWQQCERLTPHVLNYIANLENRENDQELAKLLEKTADYLKERAQYAQAEPLYLKTLKIWENTAGEESLEVAYPLDGLATLYRELGKYEKAEPLYHRALGIWEKTEDLRITYSLYGLADLYRKLGRYQESEKNHLRAIQIMEQARGPEHSEVAYLLNGLANLYREQGRYQECEQLYLRAIRIREQTLGSDHPEVAYILNGLANLYREQSKYEQSEHNYLRSQIIWEQALGPDHPKVAFPLHGRADVYRKQGKYELAIPLYERAIQIRAQALGENNPDVAYPVNGLANLHHAQKNFDEAKRRYLRALDIWEKAFGPNHIRVAFPLNELAAIAVEQNEYEEAERLYQRSLRIREYAKGATHPDVAYPLLGLADLYSRQTAYEKAEPLYQRALQIREQAFGPDHPLVADILTKMEAFYQKQNKYEQAVACYRRAQEITHTHSKPDATDP